MITNSNQSNSLYFKQYPLSIIQKHSNQHKQYEFHDILNIQFINPTSSIIELPKYLIDNYQTLEQMYWLQWTQQEIDTNLINKDFQSRQLNKNFQNSNTQNIKKKILCLYLTEIGKKNYIKILFNSIPQYINICGNYLYTINGQELIITQLWQKVQNNKTMESNQINPSEKRNIRHQLEKAKILSMDFVYQATKQTSCQIIYFHEKKGIFSIIYNRYPQNNISIINKLIDFTIQKFIKSENPPFWYKTLIPNIIGIIFHNNQSFSLFDITNSKIILKTETKLEGWSLNLNQQILVKNIPIQPIKDFNDCLMISIGQSFNIELFLYHIKYSEKVSLQINQDTVLTNQQMNYPLQLFTSSEIIDFNSSFLAHYLIVYLDEVKILKNYLLDDHGLIYLGYKANLNNLSSKIPVAGLIEYRHPYITNRILTQQNKIWKQYRINFSSEIIDLQGLLISDLFSEHMIKQIFNVKDISELNTIKIPFQSYEKLIFAWFKEYSFVGFVKYRNETMLVRQNSLTKLLRIDQQQFYLQYEEINQNQLDSLSKLNYTFEQDIDNCFQFDQQKYRYSHSLNRCSQYQLRYQSSSQTYFENGLLRQQNQYYNNEISYKYSQQYKEVYDQIIKLSKTSHPISIKYPSSFLQHQILMKSTLSLFIKDTLIHFLQTLKRNINYYLDQFNKNVKKSEQKNKKQFEMENIHLEHTYICTILEFFINLSTKLDLKDQKSEFHQNLINEMIDWYVKFHLQPYIPHFNKSRKHPVLLQQHMQIHCKNIIRLLFRGLMKDFIPRFNKDESLFVQPRIKQDKLFEQRCYEINQKNNEFLLMLLKKCKKPNDQNNTFILQIIYQLLNPLYINPIQPNIRKFLPLSKTLIYCLLQLQILSYEKKILLLSPFLLDSQNRDIFMLIQSQTTTYYQQIQSEHQNLRSFYAMSYKLSQKAAYLLEIIILTNSDFFCYQIQNIKYSRSFSDFLAKMLYTKIQFNYIENMDSICQSLKFDRNVYNDERQIISEQLKATIQRTNHQLALEQYELLRKDVNIIQRVFSKFYNKIYTNANQFDKTRSVNEKTASNDNPSQLVNKKNSRLADPNLSKWQLQKIFRLFKKYQTQFKNRNNIDDMLNLHYAMIRIYLYRLKLGSNQIDQLNEIQKYQYADILKECINKLYQSIHNFKIIYPTKFYNDQNIEQHKNITDQEFIDIMRQTYDIQSRINDNYLQTSQMDDDDTKFSDKIHINYQQSIQDSLSIYGNLISEQWMNIIKLVIFDNNIQFINYHDKHSILMRILKTILKQRIPNQLNNLMKIQGKKNIVQIIKNSNELKQIYKISSDRIKQILPYGQIMDNHTLKN